MHRDDHWSQRPRYREDAHLVRLSQHPDSHTGELRPRDAVRAEVGPGSRRHERPAGPHLHGYHQHGVILHDCRQQYHLV